ncbi:MAG: hypothetical protein E7525_02345 [Ruminococcaceae bacterium]|nr:hypothetical protein [Oscillospiraceae bacterium]
MGNIYCGTGWNKTLVGEYDNGMIYVGTGWSRTAIGEYDSGAIYQGTGWSKTAVGEYDGGTIYQGVGWSKTAIGGYDGGTIYQGTGWSKTAIGEYGDSPAGAAALLLFPELQRAIPVGSNDTNDENNRNNKEHDPSPDPAPGCFGIFAKILAIIAGVILFLILVYHMYFTVSWKWANFAMFLTGFASFAVTNIVILSKIFKKTTAYSQAGESLIAKGLLLFLVIGVLIAFIIYIIEQLIVGKLTIGMFLLGFIIAPVNFIVYAVPFAVVEFIVLLIVKLILKKRK